MKIFITALAALLLFACKGKNENSKAAMTLTDIRAAEEKESIPLTDSTTSGFCQVAQNKTGENDKDQQQQQ